jgi:hypothetical protein
MHTEDIHPNLIPLEPDAKIWRYMDLDKFHSLLERKALFFCRADKFSDPFEGSIPRKEAEYRLTEAEKNAQFFGRQFDLPSAEKNVRGLQFLHRKLKRSFIINCWHINNNESDAMWRLYLKDNEGVAIQSNAMIINKIIANTGIKIDSSKIRYINYENDIWYHPIEYPRRSYNLMAPFVHKRVEFKHEQEFRLIYEIQEASENEDYWDSQESHIGKFIDVDVSNLIEKVWLPPTIDIKAEEAIIKMTKELGFDFEFAHSKLESEPYY